MPKPEARDQGASIQYFSPSKPTKKDNGNWARQNEVALGKANQQIMAWRGQYERDFGRPVPNYGMQTNLPPAPKPKFVPSKPEKKAKKSVTIDEKGSTSGTSADKSEHGQTEALKQRKALIDGIISQLQDDARTGALTSQIEGVNKTKKKNWFERNVGSKIGAGYNAVAGSIVGDAAGRGLNLISRPTNATLGVLTKAKDQGLLSLNPTTAASPPETPDQIEKRTGKHLTPQQRANAQAIFDRHEQTHKESYWHRALMGLEGKQQYSFTGQAVDEYTRANDYKTLKGAQRIAPIAAGFATDVATDPMNAIGAGIVAKGAEGVKSVRAGRTADEVLSAARKSSLAAKTARDAEEAVKSSKIADEVLARVSAETPHNWKAPLELTAGPKAKLETGGVPGRAWELTNDAKSAARADEVATEVRKMAQIKDASEAGFRELRNETAKSARAVEGAKALVKKGALKPEELAGRVAAHEELLTRMEAAQQVREVAKHTPVGIGKPALLEKQVERLTKLTTKAPHNRELVQKLARTQRDLEAARLADLPNNHAKVLEMVQTLSQGGKVKVTPETVKAVVNSSQSVQDQLIALMKEAEAGGPKVADVPQTQLTKAQAAANRATEIAMGKEADLPSTRLVAAINEATNKATKPMASTATLSEAAGVAKDAASTDAAVKTALDMLNEAGIFGRPITKAGIRSKVAQHALQMIEDSGVQEAALARTGEKVAALKSTGEKLIPSARKAAMFNESLLEEVLPTTDTMTRILEEGIGKRFAIRFAGKDLGEFKPIGDALSAMHAPFELVGKLGSTGPGQTFAKAFKMGAHFPDETNYIRQAAENEGIATHIEWANNVMQEFTNTVTHEEAKQIRRAIEGDYALTNPHLEQLRQRAVELSKEIFAKQAALGKYMPSQEADGYVYHYYHSRNKRAIKAFKDARNADIKAGIKGAPIETAKKAGLRPEERIDRILIMQHRDYVRDLQRANFRQGVIDNFGVMTDNPALANGLGLEEVSGKSMNKMFQDKAAAQKAKWYLPPEIHETFKSMDKLMGIGHNTDADGFLGAYDAFVRMFKTSATIGNPGNWVNNTIGDFFLNYIDGVRSPAWYKKAAGALRVEGQEGARTVSIGGHSVDTGQFLDVFKRKAPSGGFIRSEGMGHISRLGSKGVRGLPGRFVRGTQNAYETREEWVRLAHYMHATDDEARRLLRRGYTWDKAYDAATELAAKRVAKWNIDYTAITPFERAIRKRFVPFYTFMRKATPLMLEGMITRPGKMIHYDMAKRAIEKMLGVPAPEDDGTVWPEWAKQQGITRLTGGDEPLYLRDPSPLNVVNRLLGGESYRAPIANVGNQMAPPIRMGMEAISGKTLFNDRKIDNWGDYMLNQVPTASIIARGVGHPLSAQKTTTSGTGTSLVERLGIVGVPVGKMTENRQQAAVNAQLDETQGIFKQVNDAITPWKITKTTSKKNGTYYIVHDADKKIVARKRDFNEAVRATQSSG